MLFQNRQDAGHQLSLLLNAYKDKNVVVYALPRGGVVVAAEIAEFLHAPLDLIFAHKIGHPYQPEYAIAAVSESGYLLESPGESFHATDWLQSEKERQIEEIKKKREKYLKGKPLISVKGKIAIIVDDGVATGLTMQVGIKELQNQHPKQIIVAIPVAPKSTANVIKTMVDDLIGVEIDDDRFLGSVGAYYGNFKQVEDEEVISILDHFKR